MTEPALMPERELLNMDTQSLRAELTKTITVTARSLQHMALVWRELERRGEDLSDLRSGLAAFLPMVAGGRLPAEAVVKYANKSMLVKALAALPAGEQSKLLNQESVEVYEIGPDGNGELTTVPLARISSAQIRTVFGPHGVRSPVEQKNFAKALYAPKTKTTRPSQAALTIDKKTGQLKRGRSYVLADGKRINAEDLLNALSAFYKVDLYAKLQHPEQSHQG